MKIGIVGKPNVGKSTFFAAVTMANAEIANFPFTTRDPNIGVGYVRKKCPHIDIGKKCNPNNSKCIDGERFIPVQIIDVAGLVPDAHKGKGLGYQFLDDLRQADALIHIVDISGSTDAEGNPVGVGQHDYHEDIKFLYDEFILWIEQILANGWKKTARQIDMLGKDVTEALSERITGLGMKVTHDMLSGLPAKLSDWSDDDMKLFVERLVKDQKPFIIAGNKADLIDEPVESIDLIFSEYELALRKANDAGMIKYVPGDDKFEVLKPDILNTAQRNALEKIGKTIKGRGTGIQGLLNHVVFDILDMIVVYPVEDENKYTNKDGDVLPDALLVKKGITAKELAYKIHTDIGKGFIRAIDARTKRVIGSDHVLKDNDIIKIISKA